MAARLLLGARLQVAASMQPESAFLCFIASDVATSVLQSQQYELKPDTSFNVILCHPV